MKKLILINIIFLISIFIYAQDSKWSAGTMFTPEWNTYRNENNYRKTNLNYKFGLLSEFKINKNLSFISGITYIQRTYNIKRPYDHCYFCGPDNVCTTILVNINKTKNLLINIPLNIKIKKSFFHDKISPYFTFGINTNFLIQGIYYSPGPENSPVKVNEIKFFGNSFNTGPGVEYILSDRLKLNIETIFRIRNYQRTEEILFGNKDTYDVTTFDNTGLGILLLYTF